MRVRVQLQLIGSLANEDGLGYTWLLSWQNPFYRDGLQVVFKSILLKFLGQLCMLTKFTNKTCLFKKNENLKEI